MLKVYFLTSSHYNPAGPDPDPLCQVWIGHADDHTEVFSKVYRSFDQAKMICLASQISRERKIPMPSLSADPWIEEIYTRQPEPGG